jgi:NADH-quinone oxidoreductase subunit L
MTHAFFKALMFLGAGSVIHGMHHEQDMRRMGGLRKYMPKTYMTFMVGWLAICGIIPFSGFWSKDEILWQTASTSYIPGGWLLWLIGTIAATCTAFYMTRLMAMTFWGKPRFLEKPAGGEADEAHAHAYDEGLKPHDALMESAGDRPHHEPGAHVGEAHDEHVAHDVGGAHAADEHGHGAHGHGSHVPHESPPSMWVPLAALAVLAAIGGLIGISPAFTGGSHVGGRLNIVTWLEPVIWNPQTRAFDRGTEAAGGEHAKVNENSGALLASTQPSAPSEETHGEAAVTAGGGHEGASPYGDTGFNLAHWAEKSLGERGAEWLFIIISLIAAGIGIFLGWLFYVKKPSLPDVWANRLRPLYRASFNKYWVDELYGKLFTRRTMDAARGVYAVDSKVIDGAVNGSAGLTRMASRITGTFDKYIVDGIVNGIAGFIGKLMSRLIRTAQTGLTANYALVMVLGLVVAVALFFGKELWQAVFGFQFSVFSLF